MQMIGRHLKHCLGIDIVPFDQPDGGKPNTAYTEKLVFCKRSSVCATALVFELKCLENAVVEVS